jgi:hypothetical protein
LLELIETHSGSTRVGRNSDVLKNAGHGEKVHLVAEPNPKCIQIAFGMTANAKQGGFFPTGLNGKITMSGGPVTDANLA